MIFHYDLGTLTLYLAIHLLKIVVSINLLNLNGFSKSVSCLSQFKNHVYENLKLSKYLDGAPRSYVAGKQLQMQSSWRASKRDGC